MFHRSFSEKRIFRDKLVDHSVDLPAPLSVLKRSDVSEALGAKEELHFLPFIGHFCGSLPAYRGLTVLLHPWSRPARRDPRIDPVAREDLR